MMAMHDELDARQAEISKRDDSIGQLMRQIDGVCIELADKITENTELNERIDAYIDLVRRMADELKGWSTGSVHYPTINLLDEAEAMTGGNYDV